MDRWIEVKLERLPPSTPEVTGTLALGRAADRREPPVDPAKAESESEEAEEGQQQAEEIRQV